MEEFFDELRKMIIDNIPNDIKEVSFSYKLESGEEESYKLIKSRTKVLSNLQ